MPRHNDRLNGQEDVKRRETPNEPTSPAVLLTVLPPCRFYHNLGANTGIGVDGLKSSALGGLSDPPTSALQPSDPNVVLVLVHPQPNLRPRTAHVTSLYKYDKCNVYLLVWSSSSRL